MTDSTESVNQTNSNLQQASRPASDIPNASADEEGHTDQEEIPFRDGVTFDEVRKSATIIRHCSR